MKRFSKLVVVLAAMAFAAILVTACGQSASSSGSASGSASSSAEPTQEELIAEVTKLGSFDDVKSVTVDALVTLAPTSNALGASSQSSSSDSGDSASGNAPKTMMDAKMLMDMSDVFKMYMTTSSMGSSFELYVNGDNAVLVTQGVAVGGTVQEMGMESFASMDAIMSSQGAQTKNFAETVDTIERTTEGDDTVYTITFDMDKVKEAGIEMGTLGQSGSNVTPTSLTMTYRVNADGEVSNITASMEIVGFIMAMNMDLYDYGTTVVPDAPEPTVNYSDIQ